MLKNLPRLLFFVPNEDYFLSHRLPMARAAQEAGYSVGVITNIVKRRERIEAEGLDVLHLPVAPGINHPLGEIKVIYRLYQIYQQENPHVVHNVTLKAITYGGISAFFARVPHVINAVAGMGYIFNSNHPKARLIRRVLTPALWFLLRRKRASLLLQNKDDLEFLVKHHMARVENSTIIPGSGVELEKYTPTPLPSFDDKVYCGFSGRMIGIKGLDTMKKAFAILKETAPHITLRLCGMPDENNPGSWTEAQVSVWAEEPNVEWRGFCKNMPEIWAKTHIALQPSNGGEGIPKALLEAAACGRPLIATDVPGCREVVEYAQNGYLIPPRDPEALADAILKLASDKDTCKRFAEYSPYVIRNRGLSATDIQQKTKELYLSFLA